MNNNSQPTSVYKYGHFGKKSKPTINFITYYTTTRNPINRIIKKK